MSKFDKYDVVKKLCNYQGIDFTDFDDEEELQVELEWERPDDEYMIICSDLDEGLGAGCEYVIISIETGNEEAWWDEDYLRFIRKGTREEYLQAKTTLKRKTNEKI